MNMRMTLWIFLAASRRNLFRRVNPRQRLKRLRLMRPCTFRCRFDSLTNAVQRVNRCRVSRLRYFLYCNSAYCLRRLRSNARLRFAFRLASACNRSSALSNSRFRSAASASRRFMISALALRAFSRAIRLRSSSS